jgi:hypothetical protein
MWAALFKGTHCRNREGLIDLSRDFRFHSKHRADARAEVAREMRRILVPSFNAGRPNLRPDLVPLAFARSITAGTRGAIKPQD